MSATTSASFNEQWVESLRGETPSRGARPVPELTAARLGNARGDDRRRVERRVVHAGRQGHVRPIHADPRVRLLAARTGHPRRGRDDPVTSRVSPSRSCSTRWRRRSASSSARRRARPRARAVTFALTDGGSVVRELHVEVGERATVVPAAVRAGDGDPDDADRRDDQTLRRTGRPRRSARSGGHRRRPLAGVENSWKTSRTRSDFVLNYLHQRKEVVQHMPDNLYGTLEVVGR